MITKDNRLFRFFLLFCCPLATLPLLSAGAKPIQEKRKIQFNRDIRPILSDNCFACHGPDRNKRQANLRLDQRQSALEHGAIVSGQPAKSKLVQRISSLNAALQMPPASFNKKLTQAQKDLLTQWIKEGGEYQAHWAYMPIARPAVPIIRNPQSPIRNQIDSFILAKLQLKGIKPSLEADKRTLCRRLYLDLVGMPPTTVELDAYLADTSPNAYEKLVDKLLSSPHYGERMAVPWLDVVRYADTVGFHGDQNQNSWAYRDYVVESFNRNKPFDRFTLEQIAGDLLPDATAETRTATCFNRLNMVTREGGAQPKEYLAKYAADRVRTVSMTWLGSTFGCCECHDHKYDPFTQKDFYSLAAFFADMRQWGVYADYSYTPEPELRGVNNDSPFPPEIQIESLYLKQRIARQKQRVLDVALRSSTATTDKTAVEEWRKSAVEFLNAHPDGWEIPADSDASVAGAKAARTKSAQAKPAATPTALPPPEIQSDGSVTLPGQTAATLEIDLHPKASSITALRIELLASGDHGGKILRGGAAGDMLTLTAAVKSADSKPRAIAFRYAGANIWEPRYFNSFDLIGVQRGWKLSSKRSKETHTAVWLLDTPLKMRAGETLALTFPNMPAGQVRVAVSPFAPEELDSPVMPAGLRAALDMPDEPANRNLAAREYLCSTGWNPDALKQVKALEADIASCRRGVTPVMVTESTTPKVVRVLPRGNWQDESGAVVEPAVAHFLPQPANAGKARLSRVDLANWIVSPQNPLTARVFVNRLWKQFFGNGLSLQVEDLGAQGEAPSHPELLDWLASEFMSPAAQGAGKWDVKHMVRLMVTSATYRQSSKLRPELHDSDPNNRLLASQNPRRLEAEFVRDNALKVAGLLNEDIGGPPCKPYQPGGYYANLQFPDRDYIADSDDRQWRRGVYMHWQRTFLHPMLANFDAPSREDCIAARNQANTPQQALTLLNDPEFVEAARAFASRLASTNADDAARLDLAYQSALGRSIRSAERDSLLRFLKSMREEYKQRPEDAQKLLKVGSLKDTSGTEPVETAAWVSVCRVILNLHETITRY